MKIAPYVERLNASREYREFAKQHANAFMVAGFFVLDFESGNAVHQIDYYVPSENKVAAFTLDKKITLQMLSLLSHKVPEQLDLKTKIDLDALKGLLEEEMKNRTITEDIKKLIAVIQNLNGKKIWSVNGVLSGMGILKATVDDESQTVLKMEKASIFDYVKQLPAKQLASMTQQAAPLQSLQQQGATPSSGAKPSKEAVQNELNKLDQLEKAIEQEKALLQKEISNKKEKTKKETKAKKTAK